MSDIRTNDVGSPVVFNETTFDDVAHVIESLGNRALSLAAPPNACEAGSATHASHAADATNLQAQLCITRLELFCIAPLASELNHQHTRVEEYVKIAPTSARQEPQSAHISAFDRCRARVPHQRGVQSGWLREDWSQKLAQLLAT